MFESLKLKECVCILLVKLFWGELVLSPLQPNMECHVNNVHVSTLLLDTRLIVLCSMLGFLFISRSVAPREVNFKVLDYCICGPCIWSMPVALSRSLYLWTLLYRSMTVSRLLYLWTLYQWQFQDYCICRPCNRSMTLSNLCQLVVRVSLLVCHYQ